MAHLAKLAQKLDQGALSKRVVDVRVKGKRRVLLREVLHPPRRHPRGDEIDLVQDEDEMLVRLFVAQVLFNVLGASAHGVAGVQDLDEDVAAVHHLVQLRPDAPRLPLAEHPLPVEVTLGILLARLLDDNVTVLGRIVRGLPLLRVCNHLRHAANRQLRPLSLSLFAKCFVKRLCVQNVHLLRLCGILEEGHRQLVLAHNHGVRVTLRLNHGVAELGELLLTNNTRVTEPPSVRLDTCLCSTGQV